MLLTDGNPNTNEDLRVYESAILNVAKNEAIDLDVKRGLATEEVAQEVLDFVLNRAAEVDPRAGERRSVGVSDVVVSRQMKRWHALHSLEVFYRDGFNNQLNDRYKEKFFEYRQLARRAREQTFQFGVGLVLDPLPVAEPPVFGYTAGPLVEPLYYGSVTWVNAAGQEGAPSVLTSFEAPPGSVPTVDAVNPPAGATGFHVYLGTSPEAVTRQTSTPVALGETFTLPASGLVSGVTPGDGQAPDVFLTGGPVLRRG